MDCWLSLLVLLHFCEWILAQNTSECSSTDVTGRSSSTHEPRQADLLGEEGCAGRIRSLEEYDRIVNGVMVEEGEFPFLVVVTMRRNVQQANCAASIISKLHVLGAAHCYTHPMKKAGYYKVSAGARDFGGFFGRPETQQIRWVEAAYIHPGYRHRSNLEYASAGKGVPPPEGHVYGPYDMAILEVEYPFVFGKYVAAIPVRRFEGSAWLDAHVEKDKIQCTAAGWGVTSPEYNYKYDRPDFTRLPLTKPIAPRKVNMTLRTAEFCQSAFGKKYLNTSMFICTYDQCVDSCKGDSGGPLLCYIEDHKPPILAATTSFGLGCAGRGTPGIYTRIDAVETWIRAMIGDEMLDDHDHAGARRSEVVSWWGLGAAVIIYL